MDVIVPREHLEGLTDEHKARIAEILKQNFGNKNLGLDFDNMNFKSQEGAEVSLLRGGTDCLACDVGYTAAVALCALLPWGAPACVAAATLARQKCRDINC